MTKQKKLELQKYKEQTKNMSEEEKKVYDKVLDLQAQYEKLVYELHTTMFPEEYDLMYDSSVEAQERRRGNNPMRESYAKKVNEKREKLGLLPLEENGLPRDRKQSLSYCQQLLSKKIEYGQEIII